VSQITLIPIITGTPENPLRYNLGIAETFSWIPIENNVGRPLYARASYITNLKDLTISLSASDVNIGGVEIMDGSDHSIRASVVTLNSGENALLVQPTNLNSVEDSMSIGDKNGFVAAVMQDLSALRVYNLAPLVSSVYINGVVSISGGQISIVNPITSVSVNNQLSAFSIVNPITSVSVNNQLSAFSIVNPITSVEINGSVVLTDVSGNFATITSETSSLNVNVTNSLAVTVDSEKGFPITFADSANFDAFGKLRVSMPHTIFDSKTVHGKSSLFWSEAVFGSGAIHFTNQGDASVTLSATSANSYAIRQTRQRFNYQPGKSQLAMFTGILEPTSTAIKRYGLFTSLTSAPFTPNLGLYFETQTDSPTSIAVVQNNGSSLVASVSAKREQWNIDKLDGNGISGKNLSLSAANIFLIDFEWLGVGRVRFGAVIDGQVCYCHEINNAGRVQGAYLASPNLPVRAEIRQSTNGSANSLKMICCSVISEGGANFTGVTRGIDTGASSVGIDIQIPGNRRALIGLRLQSSKLDSTNEVLNASVVPLPHQAATYCPYRYELVINPLMDKAALTWNSVDSNSNLEYSIAPNNNISLSGGTVITSGYSTLGQTIDLSGYRFEKFLRLGCSLDGIRDEVWLVATPLINNTIDGFHGSLTFIESD